MAYKNEKDLTGLKQATETKREKLSKDRITSVTGAGGNAGFIPSIKRSGSGSRALSMDQATYDRYDQAYQTWQNNGGKYSAEDAAWIKQQGADPLATWRKIRNSGGALLGEDKVYRALDADTYDAYDKAYGEWERTGKYSDDFASIYDQGDRDLYLQMRQARNPSPVAGIGTEDWMSSLDPEVLEAVRTAYRDSWVYDPLDPEDMARQEAGQPPKNRDKYYGKSGLDQWLYSQGLPSTKSNYFQQQYQKQQNAINAQRAEWAQQPWYDFESMENGEAIRGELSDYFRSTWKYANTPEDRERQKNGQPPASVAKKYTKSPQDQYYLEHGLPPASEIGMYAEDYDKYQTSRGNLLNDYITRRIQDPFTDPRQIFDEMIQGDTDGVYRTALGHMAGEKKDLSELEGGDLLSAYLGEGKKKDDPWSFTFEDLEDAYGDFYEQQMGVRPGEKTGTIMDFVTGSTGDGLGDKTYDFMKDADTADYDDLMGRLDAIDKISAEIGPMDRRTWADSEKAKGVQYAGKKELEEGYEAYLEEFGKSAQGKTYAKLQEQRKALVDGPAGRAADEAMKQQEEELQSAMDQKLLSVRSTLITDPALRAQFLNGQVTDEADTQIRIGAMDTAQRLLIESQNADRNNGTNPNRERGEKVSARTGELVPSIYQELIASGMPQSKALAEAQARAREQAEKEIPAAKVNTMSDKKAADLGYSLYRDLMVSDAHSWTSPMNETQLFAWIPEDKLVEFVRVAQEDGAVAAGRYWADELRPEAEASMREWEEQHTKEYALAHPGMATAKAIAMTIPTGIMGIEQTIAALTGDYRENDWRGTMGREKTQIQQYVADRISKSAGEGWAFLYNTGISMAESLQTMALGDAGLILTGFRVSGSKVDELIDRGIDSRTAGWYGLVAGATEALTEKASIDHLYELKNNGQLVDFLKQALWSQGMSEGSEEVVSEIVDIIGEWSLPEDKSQFKQIVSQLEAQGMSHGEAVTSAILNNAAPQVAMAFAGGYVSGALFGFGGQIVQGGNAAKSSGYSWFQFEKGNQILSQYEQALEEGGRLFSEDMKGVYRDLSTSGLSAETISFGAELFQQAAQTPQVFATPNAAAAVAKMLDAVKQAGMANRIWNAETQEKRVKAQNRLTTMLEAVQSLYAQSQQALNDGNLLAHTKFLNDLNGKMGEYTRAYAEAEAAMQTDQAKSEQRQAEQESTVRGTMEEAQAEITASADNTVKSIMGEETVDAIRSGAVDVDTVMQGGTEQTTTESVEEQATTETEAETEEEQSAETAETATESEEEAPGSNVNKQARIETEADKVAGENKAQRQLREEYEAQMEELEGAMRDAVEDGDMETQAALDEEMSEATDEFEQAYEEAGRETETEAEAETENATETETEAEAEAEPEQRNTLPKAENGGSILDAIMKDALNHRSEITAEAEAREQTEIRQAEQTQLANAQPGVYVQGINTQTLTENQRRDIGILENLGKRSGTKFVLHDTIADEGGAVVNGYYDPSTDTVHINANAVGDGILFYAGHEVTHRLRKRSAGDYKTLSDSVMRYMNLSEDALNGRISGLQERYRQAGHPLSREDAIEEIIANAVPAAFGDQNFVNGLANENRGLFHRIRNWLHRIADQIGKAVQGEAQRGGYEDAEKLMQNAQAVREMAANFDRALRNMGQHTTEQAQQKTPSNVTTLDTMIPVQNEADTEERRAASLATQEAIELSDINTKFSLREKEPPKKTIKCYKAFYARDGKLYPPMVSNITDEEDRDTSRGKRTSGTMRGLETPVGVWLDADVGGIAVDENGVPIRTTTTGRLQVQNDKGGGTLAFRPGWHLGEWPDAKQFYVTDPVTGEPRSVMPDDLVFAECEIAADIDYQLEALELGVSEKGGFNRTQAGLPRIPVDGYYKYRTNADPSQAPWYISGAMRINRILDDAECAEICAQYGVTPAERKSHKPIDLEAYGLKRGTVTPTEHLERFRKNEASYRNDDLLAAALADERYENAYRRRRLNFNDPTLLNEFRIDRVGDEQVEAYRQNYRGPENETRYSLGNAEYLNPSDPNTYTYQTLTSLPDMSVYVSGKEKSLLVGESRGDMRRHIVEVAQRNLESCDSFMWVTNENGDNIRSVVNHTIGRRISASDTAIRHGLDRRLKVNAKAVSVIGNALENAIPINRNDSEGRYLMLGATEDGDTGEPIGILFFVNDSHGDLEGYETFDVLHSPNGKKIEGADFIVHGTVSDDITPSTIRIEDLLNAVKTRFSDVLPTDVLNRLGVERTESRYSRGLQYSLGSRVTPEQDAAYMDAVNSGDMETAQRMVDEAAEKAFSESRIRDEDGKLLPVYHGTSEQFRAFDMSKGRANMDIQGAFFSPWEIDAEGYGENVGRYYLDIKNPAPEGIGYRALNRFKGQNNAGIKAREYLISLGYDGVNNGNEEYIAFYPEQIKRADPVTYHPDGTPVDLSERFNRAENDISYSLGERTPAQQQARINQLEGMVNRREQWLRDYKAKAAERQREIRQRNDVQALRKNVIKRTKELNDWLQRPTKEKHVPIPIQTNVAGILQQLDISISKRGSMDARKFRESVRGLKDFYVDYLAGIEDKYDFDFDGTAAQGIVQALNNLEQSLKDTPNIGELNRDQLKDLVHILGQTRAAVKISNRLLSNARYQTVDAVGQQTQEDSSNRREKKIWRGFEGAQNLIEFKTMDAFSWAKAGGTGAESVISGIEKGFQKAYGKVKEGVDFYEGVKEALGIRARDLNRWDKDAVNVTLESGNTARFTTMQIMELYALSKREQARYHLLTGGIELKDMKNGPRQTDVFYLTENDLQSITSRLTQQQKDYIDALQTFLSTDAADWGNEPWVAKYGYETFGEENYWPIKSAARGVKTQDPEAAQMQNAMLNMGITKALTPNANNPVTLGNADDTFIGHVAQMANMNGLALPIDDALKWFNWIGRNEDGTRDWQHTTKSALEKMMGPEGTRYFVQLLKDVNGLSTGNMGTQFASQLMSKYKRAAVAGKLRVVVQQPTAVLRSFAMIDPKYFANSYVGNIKQNIREMQEHSPLAWWKAQGNYDIGTGRSLKSIFNGSDDLIDNITDKAMTPAGWADDFAWGWLWSAVKREIADKRSDLAPGTDEYWDAVNDRFSDIVNQTQVVDGVLQRSEIMRSKNGLDQMASAFMAEPIKSFNLIRNRLMDVIRGGGKEARKALFRALIAFGLSVAVNNAVLAAHDALKRRKKGDPFSTAFSDNFRTNTLDDVLPWNYVPYIKDIAAIMQGDSVDRMDMSMVSDVYKAINNGYKYMNGDSSYTGYKVGSDILKVAGAMAGVPTTGLLATMETVVNGIHPGAIKTKQYLNKEDRAALKEAGISYDEGYGIVAQYKAHPFAEKSASTNADKAMYLLQAADMVGGKYTDEQFDILTEIIGMNATSYDPAKSGSFGDWTRSTVTKYVTDKGKELAKGKITQEKYDDIAERYGGYLDILTELGY